MLIGVLSDTHDNLANMRKALEFFAGQKVELVVHCGDWKSPATLAACGAYARELSLPVRGVLGNNDLDVTGMLAVANEYENVAVTEGVLSLSADGKRIAAYHGHHKQTDVAEAARKHRFRHHTARPYPQTVDTK